jgi:GMP synthase-like glutamine amidotransferase
MRTHCFQHVPFEGLGSIESWLKDAGYEITHTRLFEAANFPDAKTVDFLVIMGGPMSVNDEDEFPWLVAEKRFIREFIGSGKPVLGICLGAQMIASAMGARVFRNPVKEIGWFPIHAIDSNEDDVFRFPPFVTVFHWHGETFDLPPKAICLAKSAGCQNQAFQLDKSVIGLQFHLETTPESARELISNCRNELVPSPYIQAEEEILSASQDRYSTIHHLMGSILAFLLRGNGRKTVSKPHSGIVKIGDHERNDCYQKRDA